MEVKVILGVSDGNEKHVFKPLKKGKPGYKVAETLAELCFIVRWKVEMVNNESGYLVQEISKKKHGKYDLIYCSLQ